MDPNVALANIRNMMKARVFHTNHTHLQATREAFEALDGWLMRGGFLPDDWQQAQDASADAVRTALARKVCTCTGANAYPSIDCPLHDPRQAGS